MNAERYVMLLQLTRCCKIVSRFLATPPAYPASESGASGDLLDLVHNVVRADLMRKVAGEQEVLIAGSLNLVRQALFVALTADKHLTVFDVVARALLG